ncbi:MAG: DNA translocase FtsK [Candidatus Flexifilum sp.]
MADEPKRSSASPKAGGSTSNKGAAATRAASGGPTDEAKPQRSRAAQKSQSGEDQPPVANPDTRPDFDRAAEFWERVLDVLSLPSWIDEIAALLLIVFGIVSMLSLFNVASDTTVAAAWSNALTGLFGYGAAVISAGILLLGVILLLPRFGIHIHLPARRIIALEFGFLAALGLLHLASSSPDQFRSIARLGQGGGQIGWALSTALTTLLGPPLAAVTLSAIFLTALAIILGISRRQISAWLMTTAQELDTWGTRIRAENSARRQKSRSARAKVEPILVGADGSITPSPEAVQAQRARSFTILRIRPDWKLLPPSQRPVFTTPRAVAALEGETGSQPTSPAAALDSVPASVQPGDGENGLSTGSGPLILASRREINFNAIGTIKTRATKTGGPGVVERPDGRIKRYFTVAGMKEPRQVPKRDPVLPPLSLLRDIEINLPNEQEINQNVVLIENTLLEFDIDVDVVDVKVGPTVTQYAVQPFSDMTSGGGSAPTFSRTRINKIASLANDLALAMSAKRLRLETPVPGHTYIGIEVPNKNPSVVALRSVIESRGYQEQAAKKKSPLFIPLGRDVAGAPVGVDLTQMPHLLIAGTTGSGKSVCIAAIASALILENPPDAVKLVMLDPKMVELSRFNGIPHLLGPVEVDQERIIGVLRWCTREMDRRYKVLEEAAARNIDTYNERLGRRRKEQYMPYIVIMIDEIGDLMLSHPDETEKTITRLAQMARAVGMHLIVATQRPSTDVITGLIKANFPSRISFAVASGIDSRVILDTIGAETLLGRGDMLYQAADTPQPRRLQGCYVSDDEVRALTQYWKDWAARKRAAGELPIESIAPWERGLTRREFLAETDPLLEQAIALVIATGEASASLIQRRLGVGYPRAARIMDLLVELGVVGESKDGGRSREVLIKPGKDPFKDLIEKRMRGGGAR